MRWMGIDVTDVLQCIKWSAKLANEGTDKWVLDKKMSLQCVVVQRSTTRYRSIRASCYRMWRATKYISISWSKKLVSFDVKRARQTSPLVLNTICPGCPTWGHSPKRPQRACLGRDWQTLQIRCLRCPLGGYSQNHFPTPVRWSPRRPRWGHCSSACRRASGLRAGCPPPSETSPRLEVLDWFLQSKDTSFHSDSRSQWSHKWLQAVVC